VIFAVVLAGVFGIGLIVGLLVGRWWALVCALGVFLWVGVGFEVDVPSIWVLALIYAGIAAAGIAAGVLGRAALRRSGPRSTNG
jgi:hypothetical protein